MIQLDIISDPICPWCYIGKAGLDQALARAGHNPFNVSWRIFQLNPEMPAEGMDRKAYLEGKFGGPQQAREVYGRIADAASAAGLDVDLDKIARTPNTFDAHRLIRWSQTAGTQGDVTNRLFEAYFKEGRDISDHAVLLEIAEAVGMERDVVARLLEGDADVEELKAEEQTARQMGVAGVPCFIINGQHVVQGAQGVDTWEKIIAEVADALNRHAEEQTAQQEGTSP